MTDTSNEALDVLVQLIDHNIQWDGLQDIDREAYQQCKDTITALRSERDAAHEHIRVMKAWDFPGDLQDLTVKLEAAEAREQALLSTYNAVRADARRAGVVEGLREAAKMYEDGGGPGVGGWDYFGDYRDAILARAEQIERMATEAGVAARQQEG